MRSNTDQDQIDVITAKRYNGKTIRQWASEEETTYAAILARIRRNGHPLARRTEYKSSQLLGQTFTWLKVVAKISSEEKKRLGLIGRGQFWKCKCICGNVVYTTTHRLTHCTHGKKSCGCYPKGAAAGGGIQRSEPLNLKDRSFGYLFVLEYVGYRRYCGHYWLVECRACGKHKAVLQRDLLREHSCGCMNGENRRLRNRQDFYKAAEAFLERVSHD